LGSTQKKSGAWSPASGVWECETQAREDAKHSAASSSRDSSALASFRRRTPDPRRPTHSEGLFWPPPQKTPKWQPLRIVPVFPSPLLVPKLLFGNAHPRSSGFAFANPLSNPRGTPSAPQEAELRELAFPSGSLGTRSRVANIFFLRNSCKSLCTHKLRRKNCRFQLEVTGQFLVECGCADFFAACDFAT
jgi:hypothetical protein